MGLDYYPCAGCGGVFTRQELVQVTTGPNGDLGLRCKACQSEAMKDVIASRVGASDVTCASCGSNVPVHQSVRSYMPKTNNVGIQTGTHLIRVCKYCEGTDPIPPWCRNSQHRVVVVPSHAQWDPTLFPFSPLPESAKIGLCADCSEPLIWRDTHWVAMTWGALAEEWQRAGG